MGRHENILVSNHFYIMVMLFLAMLQLLWSSPILADSNAPGVAIVAPSDNETVSGKVQVSATASDNVGVTKVTFAVDGVWAGRDLTAPYTFNWDTTRYADGIAKLQATAFDAAGNKKRYTRYVTVNNQGPDAEAPGVLISSLFDGGTVSDTVQVSATASDNVGVTKVIFAIDGVWAGKDTAAPYTFNWDTSKHAGGIAEVRATAFDAAGNTSSYNVYVTVNNQEAAAAASSSLVTGLQCYGCDETNTKETATIDKYNNAEGLYKASNLWRIPLLEEDYIPQGIHVTEDGFVYMSMYHKDKDGASYKSSVVVKYSTVTNTVTDVYHLKNQNNSKYMGHAGGLVVSGDYLVVPSGGALYYFRQSDATAVTGIESEIKLAFSTSMDFGGSEYNYKVSFLSTSEDHLNQKILWTGQFSTSTSVGSHVLGYKIESDGVVNPVPIYRFYVPETVNKLQGVAVLKATHDAYTLLLSRSYGNNTSYIYRLDYDRQEGLAYKYDYNSKSITFKGPAGLEDLHATADGIWSLSESGANYYQNRDSNPWSQLFPFIIKLGKSDME